MQNPSGTHTDKQLALIRRYDPIKNIESLSTRPILLLHGDADTTVSIDSQRYFYQQMQVFNKKEVRYIRFVEIPDLNHQITLSIVEEMINWLDFHV
ncbi:alpha/beta hydrolase family protein [Desulfosporosinus sp. SB140]|uniref:alpha/beta hydrolase family protein n=1 Tax=Desulfosporosinus paludis TaxID=3115649 RepID=UPI00388D84EC